jgi:hypothetical protein
MLALKGIHAAEASTCSEAAEFLRIPTCRPQSNPDVLTKASNSDRRP